MRDSTSWNLADDCQRLVRHARGVLFGVKSEDRASAEEADRLVPDAIEAHDETGESALAQAAELTAGTRPHLDEATHTPPAANGSEASPRWPAPSGGEPRPRISSAVAASQQHVLVLSGREGLFTTPDLIGILSSQKKTGVLEVVTATETFLLEIVEGDIVHAQSDHTPGGQRLGDILVERRVIDRAALERTREHAGGPRLGTALVDTGLVSREQLVAALHVQIQHLFQRLFESPMTCFSFWAGPPMYADERLRLNATSLLLEGARVSDEKNWLWKLP